jgi:hypothetical protein
MSRKTRHMMQVGILSAVFGTGFLLGSVTQHDAAADMKSLGGAAMNAAGEQGGTLGSAAKLGTTITDMQSQLDGLQKNMTVLKSIQSALGG